LEATGPGEVTGADIKPSADYEVVNPEVHLATLDSSEARLYVEFNVEQGRGYEPAAQRNGLPIGVLPLDAIFTPVQRVNYRVEPTRVGQTINYDRLVLEVWTDGTISPTSSVNQSAELLIEQISHWANFGRANPFQLAGPSPVDSGGDAAGNVPIEELNLSVRAYNALKRHNITRVREILQMSDEELLSIRNFGDKSKQELREALIAHGFLEPGDDDVFEGEIPEGGYVASPDDDDDD
jgi:DNA-directed RNA polymerase subunit alpha